MIQLYELLARIVHHLYGKKLYGINGSLSRSDGQVDNAHGRVAESAKVRVCLRPDRISHPKRRPTEFFSHRSKNQTWDLTGLWRPAPDAPAPDCRTRAALIPVADKLGRRRGPSQVCPPFGRKPCSRPRICYANRRHHFLLRTKGSTRRRAFSIGIETTQWVG